MSATRWASWGCGGSNVGGILSTLGLGLGIGFAAEAAGLGETATNLLVAFAWLAAGWAAEKRYQPRFLMFPVWLLGALASAVHGWRAWGAWTLLIGLALILVWCMQAPPGSPSSPEDDSADSTEGHPGDDGDGDGDTDVDDDGEGDGEEYWMPPSPNLEAEPDPNEVWQDEEEGRREVLEACRRSVEDLDRFLRAAASWREAAELARLTPELRADFLARLRGAMGDSGRSVEQRIAAAHWLSLGGEPAGQEFLRALLPDLPELLRGDVKRILEPREPTWVDSSPKLSPDGDELEREVARSWKKRGLSHTQVAERLRDAGFHCETGPLMRGGTEGWNYGAFVHHFSGVLWLPGQDEDLPLQHDHLLVRMREFASPLFRPEAISEAGDDDPETSVVTFLHGGRPYRLYTDLADLELFDLPGLMHVANRALRDAGRPERFQEIRGDDDWFAAFVLAPPDAFGRALREKLLLLL